ncbi:MAG: MFS transporter [Lachnospiraceae bacterium]|nr:MFS transporter [Lachnospiraceae bacterium]
MTTKTERPGWVERICYTAGGIGIKFAFGAITGYFLIYLTNVALLDIAACSAIIAVSKVFDGISDVVIGNIIDNTVSSFGKARIWLLRMCLPFAVSLMLLFWVPPGLPQLLKYVYVFLIYNIVNTVMMTFMQISHYSMVSLLSGDRKEQTILSSIQALTRTIGNMLGAIVFVRLLNIFTDEPGNQNTQVAYTRSMTVFCAIMLVLTLITVIGTRERVQTAPAREKKSLIKESAASLVLLLKNRYWATLIVCDLLIMIMMQLMASGATYYSLYILNDMSYVSLILMTSMIPTVLTMFAVPFLTEKFGKQKVFAAGLVIAILGSIGFGLSAPSITPMLMFNALQGLGNGLHKGTIVALTADMVVYTEKTTGQFKAGTGNAGLSATEKLGTGLSSVVFGSLLATAGFNAALEVQPEAACNMISMLFIWIPALVCVVALVIFLLFFDLERKADNEI